MDDCRTRHHPDEHVELLTRWINGKSKFLVVFKETIQVNCLLCCTFCITLHKRGLIMSTVAIRQSGGANIVSIPKSVLKTFEFTS
jgi:hypothetical protein